MMNILIVYATRQSLERGPSAFLVAGALLYSKYNFLIRFIMRRIAAQAGGDVDTSRDYEHTDWGAVDRFASQFAADTMGDHGTHRGDDQALHERFASCANM